jgi:hypothetical protein
MTVAGGGDAPGGMRRDADEIERGISEFARGSHGDRGLIVTASGLAIIHGQLIVALGTAHASSDLPFAPLCPRWGSPAVSQSPASPNSENSKANPINSVKSACGIWEKICPVESRKIAKK